MVLAASPELSIPDALETLKRCKILHIFFHMNSRELNIQMKKDKFNNEIEFVKHIIRSYNKDLIF